MAVLTANASKSYAEKLKNLPASGGGGFHAAHLGVARLGFFAGMEKQAVFDDIRANVRGTRAIPDSEIWESIDKAFDSTESHPRSKGWTRPVPKIRATMLEEIAKRGDGATAAELWEASPIRIDWPREEDSWRALEFLYGTEELLLIGKGSGNGDDIPGIIGRTIRPAGEWIEIFKRRGGCPYPKLMANPLTGQQGLTKTGNPSFRADTCVASFRYMVCEFDSIPLDRQFEFWFAVPHLPIAAITHSGKKSLHALIRVDAADADEWTREVENKLFDQFFKPLGLDSSCKNESRLTRMPGHRRDENRLWQQILYLAPHGKALAHA